MSRSAIFRILALWLGLVSGSPLSGQPLPSPAEFLGFQPGSDRHLADWQQIESYFLELQKSPRVVVENLGATTKSNPFLLVTVASPETLETLEQYRQIQVLLADPRKPPPASETLFQKGKTVVLITCSIHSTEVTSSLMALELAWEMATRNDPETLEILENVILLLVPSLNPDGVNLVSDWYRETVGSAAEGTPPPVLYHDYAGHDNNRDWYMFTQKETRIAVEKIHNRWHPQIVYDLHQMGTTGARMFVPPFIDPVDQNVDPILQGQIIDLGGAIFSALLAAGRKGIVTNAIYDAFTPARAYQHYHGGVRILTESASARLATPVVVAAEQLREGRNYDPRKPSWNFPVVWEGGTWTIGDILTDQKIAVRACLLHAARYREQWLRNFYKVGLTATRRERPFAFLIPRMDAQRDPESLFDLLQTLEFAGVEISIARHGFETRAQGVAPPWSSETMTSFPAGTYIVFLRQPYSAFAKTMLEIQEYPELRDLPDGPVKRPYDVTAHTLGIQLGVEVYQADERFVVEHRKISSVRRPGSAFEGTGDFWILPHDNNASVKAVNRLAAAGTAIYWAPNGFEAEGESFPAGSFLAAVRSGDSEPAGLVGDLPLRIRRVQKRPQLAWQRIRLPRTGLYRGHAPSIDEGWTRWILEQYEFPYQSLGDDAIRGEDLSRFDILVFADQSPEKIKAGLGGSYPGNYQGGIGEEGLRRLWRYCRSGKTLLFLGESTRLPIREWPLGVEEVTALVPSSEFSAPGSLLRAEVNDRHPIGYGAGGQTALMFSRSQAFASERGVPVVSYPEDRILLSGWLEGERHLAGASGLLDLVNGKGRILLVGFRTQFRAQTRATYKFLFNSLYYSTTRR